MVIEQEIQILHFPKPPAGLEWFKRAGEEWSDFSEKETGQRNDNITAIYRYLKWAYIYKHCDPHSLERQVSYGFFLKYYRIIHAEEVTEGDQPMILKSERLLQASNRAIREKKKNG